ncbi:hypothetical protein GCM10007071_16140 [Marinobacter zhanjiangensis]|uniref:Uncharacterized protein n=1 Tax=Marinobacter zhanjiangensis TaxID=578215 RepID=A0ABQ3B0R1_9GAMM|nr:hypothetical protein GCM10007071_16140 [Marinobacter zhanjiangensis]
MVGNLHGMAPDKATEDPAVLSDNDRDTVSVVNPGRSGAAGYADAMAVDWCAVQATR